MADDGRKTARLGAKRYVMRQKLSCLGDDFPAS